MEYTFDLQKIFFGDQPPLFLLEIMFRTAFLFSWTVLNLRFIGQRGVGQLTLIEFVLIIALGSAVGDPMFYEDVPLTHGMLVITLVVIFQRLLLLFTLRSPRFQDILDGVPHRLVFDGLIDLDGIKAAGLSRDELYMELRQGGVEQLGQVRRAYLEIDGHISIFMFGAEQIRPGLPLMPRNDPHHDGVIEDAGRLPDERDYACSNCGAIEHFERSKPAPACSRCGQLEWIHAGMNLEPGSEDLPPSVAGARQGSEAASDENK
jgi:uncharacterized membrane protein YcaP (DUF421 family)